MIPVKDARRISNQSEGSRAETITELIEKNIGRALSFRLYDSDCQLFGHQRMCELDKLRGDIPLAAKPLARAQKTKWLGTSEAYGAIDRI
jgi:hypothetical protein